MSINQTSSQSTSNKITQISRENCLNSCIDNNNQLQMTITDSVVTGDINYTTTCLISGASCLLKSSLDSDLINSQSSKQDAKIDQEEDLFDLLNQLFDIGSSDNINQSNYQSISNEVTQMMNSTCQNNQEITDNSLALFVSSSDIEGNINLTESGSITNQQCILTNMSKNYIKNSQYNSQTATISKHSCLAGLGGVVGIVILLGILSMFHSNHSDSSPQPKKTPTSQKSSPSQSKKTPTSQKSSPSGQTKS